MPELPEVETIARQLNKLISGQVIKGVEVLHKKSFIGDKKEVINKRIKRVWRKAKNLIIEIDGVNLLIHLKMTGQLIYQESRIMNHELRLSNKHTRVIFTLDNGKLYFNDLRIFGWIKVVQNLETEFRNVGKDVIEIGSKDFYKILTRTNRAIKIVLMDQSKVAGVGNIYANDGLWLAGVSPKRKAQSLKINEAKKLLVCLKKVIAAGIKYGGATASDENYRDAKGKEGKYQQHFLAYEQKQCQRCKGEMKKIKLGGRGTYLCPSCQR